MEIDEDLSQGDDSTGQSSTPPSSELCDRQCNIASAIAGRFSNLDEIYVVKDFSRPFPRKEDIVAMLWHSKKKNSAVVSLARHERTLKIKSLPYNLTGVFSSYAVELETIPLQEKIYRHPDEMFVVDRPFAVGETVSFFVNDCDSGDVKAQRSRFMKNDMMIGQVTDVRTKADVLVLPTKKFIVRNVNADIKYSASLLSSFSMNNHVLYEGWIGDAKESTVDVTLKYQRRPFSPVEFTVREKPWSHTDCILDRPQVDDIKEIVPGERVRLTIADALGRQSNWNGVKQPQYMTNMKKRNPSAFIICTVVKVKTVGLQVRWIYSPMSTVKPPKSIMGDDMAKITRVNLSENSRLVPLDRLIIKPNPEHMVFSVEDYGNILFDEIGNKFELIELSTKKMYTGGAAVDAELGEPKSDQAQSDSGEDVSDDHDNKPGPSGPKKPKVKKRWRRKPLSEVIPYDLKVLEKFAQEGMNGDLYGEIMRTYTEVDLLMMDGTVLKNVPGHSLVPADSDIDQMNHVPGTIICKKHWTDAEIKSMFGVIMATQTIERTCTVSWFKIINWQKCDVVKECVEVCTLFDIMVHSLYHRDSLGMFGVLLSNSVGSTNLVDIAFEIKANLDNGKQLIKMFGTGEEKTIYPWEMYPLHHEEQSYEDELNGIDNAEPFMIPPSITNVITPEMADCWMDILQPTVPSPENNKLFESHTAPFILKSLFGIEDVTPDYITNIKVLCNLANARMIDSGESDAIKAAIEKINKYQNGTLDVDWAILLQNLSPEMTREEFCRRWVWIVTNIGAATKRDYFLASSHLYCIEVFCFLFKDIRITREIGVEVSESFGNFLFNISKIQLQRCHVIRHVLTSLEESLQCLIHEPFKATSAQCVLINQTTEAFSHKSMTAITRYDETKRIVDAGEFPSELVFKIEGGVFPELIPFMRAAILTEDLSQPILIDQNPAKSISLEVLFVKTLSLLDSFGIVCMLTMTPEKLHIKNVYRSFSYFSDQQELYYRQVFTVAGLKLFDALYFLHNCAINHPDWVTRLRNFEVCYVVQHLSSMMNSEQNIRISPGHDGYVEPRRRTMLLLSRSVFDHMEAQIMEQIGTQNVESDDRQGEEIQNEGQICAEKGNFELLDRCEKHTMLSESTCLIASVSKALRREHRMLSNDLPPGIYVRAYSDRLDLLTAIIVGPVDTPFEGVPFFFDIKLPDTYPSEPPKVHYVAMSREQLNPNLYQNGKVCLSLLGTWGTSNEQEKWIPGQSNLLQLLISIQGLILVPEPFFNEAGYENRKGRPETIENSKRYNEVVVVNSMEYLQTCYQTQSPLQQMSQKIIENGYPSLRMKLLSIANECPPEYPVTMSKGFTGTVKGLVPRLDKILNFKQADNHEERVAANIEMLRPLCSNTDFAAPNVFLQNQNVQQNANGYDEREHVLDEEEDTPPHSSDSDSYDETEENEVTFTIKLGFDHRPAEELEYFMPQFMNNIDFNPL